MSLSSRMVVISESSLTIAAMNDGIIPDDTIPDGTIKSDSIKLDQFLKFVSMVQTGGEAKLLIQEGEVTVNGKIETRRGRKLVAGDRVSLFGETYTVEMES